MSLDTASLEYIVNISTIISCIANIFIAISAVLAAAAAWKALNAWKSEFKTRNEYEVARRCLQVATDLHVNLLLDRIRLSNTPLEHWNNVPAESKKSAIKYNEIVLETQFHLEEEKIGPIFKNINAIFQEFVLCSEVYFNHKRGIPLTDIPSAQFAPNENITRLVPTAIEIFETSDPTNRDDAYKKKLDQAFEPLQSLLKRYIKKS